MTSGDHFILAQALGEYGMGAAIAEAFTGAMTAIEIYVRQVEPRTWVAIAVGGTVLWLLLSRRR